VKRKPGGSIDWPTFYSALLVDVADAFLRRRKAIAYMADLSCSREFSETAEGVLERLNLDLRAGHLRLSVWADGGMWLLVCVPGSGANSGWAFIDHFHGDLSDVSAATLVGMVEATLAVDFRTDPSAQREQLRELWRRVRPRTG
jgi:hypothetical protein